MCNSYTSEYLAVVGALNNQNPARPTETNYWRLVQELTMGGYHRSLPWQLSMAANCRSLPWQLTVGGYCGN